MKITPALIGSALAVILAAVPQNSFGKEKDKGTGATSTEKSFIMKAANGGMTEVELGKVAADKGQMQDVKEFGSRMVTDHTKANNELKSVASNLGVTVPAKVDSKHQAMIDKFSKMSAGNDFDKAYIKDMVKDHETDISEFEKAEKQVKNADLKSFIEKTVPVMKEHLEMVKKMENKKS
jgi:putative membrane protein